MTISFHYTGDYTSRRLVNKVEKELRAAIRSTTLITHQVYDPDEPDHDTILHSDDQIRLYIITTRAMKVKTYFYEVEQLLQDKSVKDVYMLSQKEVKGLPDDSQLFDALYDDVWSGWGKTIHINVDSYKQRYSLYAGLYEKFYGTPSQDVEDPESCDLYWRGLYLSTIEDSNDILAGENMLRNAAEQNNLFALNFVGASLLQGFVPFNVDEDAAIKLIRKASRLGNPLAHAVLGKYLFNKQNFRKAVSLLKLGAETDDLNVYQLLGQAYREGLGCHQDFNKAHDYFKKAWVRKNLDNFSTATRARGISIQKGYWKNIAYKIETCFTVEQGNEAAMVCLARDYLYGWNGVIQDEAEAYDLLRKSAELGNADGQYLLAMWYRTGNDGAEEPNYTEAVRWFEAAAAAQGHVESMYELSRCFLKGKGVTVDIDASIKWLIQAADGGLAEAQCKLGEVYGNGEGVDKNMNLSFKYLSLSANQGYGEAEYCLGILYRDGDGVLKNSEKALDYFKKSGAHGYTDGYVEAYRMIGMEAPDDAIIYLGLAAEAGNAEAQLQMGRHYEIGFGVEKNINIAIEWYTKSASNGNKEAIEILDRLE